MPRSHTRTRKREERRLRFERAKRRRELARRKTSKARTPEPTY